MPARIAASAADELPSCRAHQLLNLENRLCYVQPCRCNSLHFGRLRIVVASTGNHVLGTYMPVEEPFHGVSNRHAARLHILNLGFPIRAMSTLLAARCRAGRALACVIEESGCKPHILLVVRTLWLN